MNNNELKLARLEELKKLIPLDVSEFIREKWQKHLLNLNWFLNKKAHEYQLWGYEWNPTKEEITSIYEEEIKRRNIIFFKNISDENFVNDKIKHLWLKKWDYISYSKPINIYEKELCVWEISHIKTDGNWEKIFLCLKYFNRYWKDENSYYYDEYKIENLKLNEWMIEYSEDFDEKNPTIKVFDKEIKTIEKEFLWDNENNYILKDFIHKSWKVFIDNKEIYDLDLSWPIFEYIWKNKYLNLKEIKKTFCIDENNKLFEFSTYDAFLYDKDHEFIWINDDLFYQENYLLSRNSNHYKWSLVIAKHWYNIEYVLKWWKIVYKNMIDNPLDSEKSFNVRLLNIEEDYIFLESQNRYTDHKILKYNEKEGVFEDFFEIGFDFIIDDLQIDLKNNLLIVKQEQREWWFAYWIDYNKIRVFSLKTKKELKIIDDQLIGLSSLTNIFVKENLLEFQDRKDNSRRDFYPKYLYKYEIKGNSVIIHKPNLKLWNEFQDFTIGDDWETIYWWKSRSVVKIKLNKLF